MKSCSSVWNESSSSPIVQLLCIWILKTSVLQTGIVHIVDWFSCFFYYSIHIDFCLVPVTNALIFIICLSKPHIQGWIQMCTCLIIIICVFSTTDFDMRYFFEAFFSVRKTAIPFICHFCSSWDIRWSFKKKASISCNFINNSGMCKMIFVKQTVDI